VDYREYPCSPDLAPFLVCFWTAVESPLAASGPRILPDGCLDVIFQRPPGGEFASQVVGTMTGPLVLPGGGAQHSFGVRFRPGKAGLFLGVAPDELTDAAVDLVDVGLLRTAQLAEALSSAPSLAAQIALLEASLRERLAETKRRLDPYVEFALSSLHATQGGLGVAELEAAAGISRQQLTRRFREAVGVPPKLYARVIRFRALIDALPHGARPDWSALAAQLGYYDQAHLIADFKAFSGLSPTAYVIAGI
jgi:AraC-like DNA-binding protein